MYYNTSNFFLTCSRYFFFYNTCICQVIPVQVFISTLPVWSCPGAPSHPPTVHTRSLSAFFLVAEIQTTALLVENFLINEVYINDVECKCSQCTQLFLYMCIINFKNPQCKFHYSIAIFLVL